MVFFLTGLVFFLPRRGLIDNHYHCFGGLNFRNSMICYTIWPCFVVSRRAASKN